MSEQQVISFTGDVIKRALQERLNQTYFRTPMQITHIEPDNSQQPDAYKVTVQPLPKPERTKVKNVSGKTHGLGTHLLTNGKDDPATEQQPA